MSVVVRTILIPVLLCLGLGFAIVRYSRLPLTSSRRIFLILLRTGWVICFALSFYQPTFVFERFESYKHNIPVLVDVSRSMQLFTPDSCVGPFLDTLDSIQKRSEGRFSFSYLAFGDSTRETGADILHFTDGKSSFPHLLSDRQLRDSRDLILVSDGHWSNLRKSSQIFPGKSIHFLQLPEATPEPFLNITYTAPYTAPSDSFFDISVSINGYSRKESELKTNLQMKNAVIKSEKAVIGKGFFNNKVTFRVRNRRPGRKLYTIRAAFDSAGTEASLIHQTIPHFLTYRLYSANPTLNKRYIAQSLKSRPDFKEDKSSPDILFVFDWDSTAERLLRTLPPHGTAVFIGCMPCKSQRTNNPQLNVRQKTNGGINSTADLSTLPPPQAILHCKKSPVSRQTTLLYSILHEQDRTETVPVLFSGRFRSRPSLFCPVEGLWRWDFWPMSISRAENESFVFSSILLSQAREILLNHLSDSFILYPPEPVSETDSVHLMMALPSTTPVFEPLELFLTIKDSGIVLDTSIQYTPQGLNKQQLSLRPLPTGNYEITSRLKTGTSTFSSNGSLSVRPDNNELSVSEQNRTFLEEFARPLDMNDSTAMHELYSILNQRSTENRTVKERIRIQRSWILLGLILSFVLLELLLRKKWSID